MPSPFDACPPSLCRLLARDSRREKALTVAQIAKAAGLSTRTVKRLSNRSSWDGLTIEVVFAFSKACGVNLLKPSISKRKFTWTNRVHTHPAAIEAWITSVKSRQEAYSPSQRQA